MNTVNLGIDVGSTTVKVVITDEHNEILYRTYSRHFSLVKECVLTELKKVEKQFSGFRFRVAITGSAGMGLAQKAGFSFVQEVFAAQKAIQFTFPDADCAVELGGEDAKILFFSGGTEQRMNGSCAGGTGAFLDQMATLLKVSDDELDKLAENSEIDYTIASRCGVFAKSDVQALINQGATKEDVAAAVFRAVVDQTVSGLAQGRKIEGKVVFLGGPLYFLKSLRRAFVKGLNLSSENAVFPDTAPVFMAYGAALFSASEKSSFTLTEISDKISAVTATASASRCEPLFRNESEYIEFKKRHAEKTPCYKDIKTYVGNAYLGVDAGSTTTKLVLLSEDKSILYEYYGSNNGKPLDVVTENLGKIYSLCGDGIKIKGSAVTGYGEDLIKSACKIDLGIVETQAHFLAAKDFCPEVDFILDIGGQDIKCFKIKRGVIDAIMLNEACSSGCGSFLQTFAAIMGKNIEDFARLGLYASAPVDFGSRCTVFMNSAVKQAQKDGADIGEISAGLSISVVKNALYKVIRVSDVEKLGKNIVVQGGTFLNDAVLRALERELGKNVIRPGIAGLMGAYGAALKAMECKESGIITERELESFGYKSASVNCGGCTAHCALTVLTLRDGRRLISGNKCERGAGNKPNTLPDMYSFKQDLFFDAEKSDYAEVASVKAEKRKNITVGLPMVLQFFEQMPLWKTFFESIGFDVVTSGMSSRELYNLGHHTIPSDTICYPAKLVHGHLLSLKDKCDFIFYPCMTYNLDEGGDNHYNCPVVAYYPEVLKANIKEIDGKLYSPYIDLNRKGNTSQKLCMGLKKYGVSEREARNALDLGFKAMYANISRIRAEGKNAVAEARRKNAPIFVLAGRPYHIDPEINHSLNKLITSLGAAVITEDVVASFSSGNHANLEVLNQWTYHSRLYRAAEYAATQPDMQIVQLVSFGCGIDAITSDEVRRITEEKGKIYTQLKIDEITNLGAAKIRLRSLMAAIGR